MRLFSQRKFCVDRREVSPRETRAAEILDSLPAAMKQSQTMNGGKVAARMAENWNPAMFAWVKAWVANYAALAGAWKHARPAIKIDRPGRAFPLIIQKGPQFADLIRRWA
jgi:hypothetical protein